MYWLYIILGLFGLFLLYFIISYVISKKLHNAFFSGHYYDDKRINYYNKEEYGLLFKSLEINVEGSIIRGGLYNYSSYDNSKIFIVCHGMWSGVSAYMQDVEFFCKRGYQVLAMNYEGTNNSDGNLNGLGNSLRCLDYIINYVKNNDELNNRDIYVYGHSWGGFATLNIPYYHKDIKGILSISPFISIKQCMKGLLPKGLWFIIPVYKLIELNKTKKYSLANAYKSLSKFKGNIVILHSRNDKVVKFKYNTNKLMKKLNNASYLIVDDRDHNPHYSLSSVLALREYSEKVSKMSQEEATLFMKTVNFHSLGELDYDLLDKALKLLLNGEISDGRE